MLRQGYHILIKLIKVVGYKGMGREEEVSRKVPRIRVRSR
jgi:hypothetical protein